MRQDSKDRKKKPKEASKDDYSVSEMKRKTQPCPMY